MKELICRNCEPTVAMIQSLMADYLCDRLQSNIYQDFNELHVPIYTEKATISIASIRFS